MQMILTVISSQLKIGRVSLERQWECTECFFIILLIEINVIDSMITSFENIITYYVNLLGTNPITANSFDIVINSEDNTGGYCRNNLIVLCEIHKKSIVFECWLAHEFAHCWATGADVFSWEIG